MQQKLIINGEEETIEIISRDKSHITFIYGGSEYRFHIDGDILRDDSQHIFKTDVHKGNVWVNGIEIKIGLPERRKKAATAVADGAITAPMNGTIMQVLTKNGDKVKKGQKLVVMEAMKLQISLDAPFDGKISALNAEAGQQVNQGIEIVRVDKS